LGNGARIARSEYETSGLEEGPAAPPERGEAEAAGSESGGSYPASSPSRARSSRLSFQWIVIVTLLATALVRLSATAGAADVTTGPPDPRGFRFRHVTEGSGTPVRFNPCAPIHYVINPDNAPAGGIQDVHTAVRMTSEATGIEFVYDGATDEVFEHPRASVQKDLYGERWAPILVSWVPQLPDLLLTESGGSPLGLGGSNFATNSDGDIVYVSGAATFQASADLRPGFGGRTWGQVILHELGHVVGLDHFDGTDSVMNPSLGLRPAAWGDGDRAGLWELGVGGSCVETPPLP
jgi:hypothetical protein